MFSLCMILGLRTQFNAKLSTVTLTEQLGHREYGYCRSEALDTAHGEEDPSVKLEFGWRRNTAP